MLFIPSETVFVHIELCLYQSSKNLSSKNQSSKIKIQKLKFQDLGFKT